MAVDGPIRARARSLVLGSAHLHTNGHHTVQSHSNGDHLTTDQATEAEVEQLEQELRLQLAVAEGAGNLLTRLDPNQPETAPLRAQVETELDSANYQIQQLGDQLNTIHSTQLINRRSVEWSPATSPDPNSLLNSPISAYPLSNNPSQSSAHGQQPDQFGLNFEFVIEILQTLDQIQDTTERLKAMDSVVGAVKTHQQLKHQLQLDDVLPAVMTGLTDKATKQLRAGTYRLLRHLVVDQQDVNTLYAACFDLFIVRSLARDDKFELEKEQAVRLVRMLLSMPDTDQPVSASVIRAIVAIAESPDEKLRLSCLHILGELVITDFGLLTNADGLRVVLQALSDGPHDLSPLLGLGFLWVMDRPGTRQYLRPGLDIEIVLAAFTEVQAKGSSQDERIRASGKIVASFAKSWSGFMYLCLNHQRAIASIVESLRNPYKVARETLVDLLFDLLRVKQPSWDDTGRLVLGTGKASEGQGGRPTGASSEGLRTNLVDQYLSVVLLVLLEVGLIETLAGVASEEADSVMRSKVAYLISEVLQLANRVLPPAYATQVQSLPDLFGTSANFASGIGRVAASNTLISLDNFNRERGVLKTHTDHNPHSAEDLLKRGQRQVETTKMHAGMQIDDASFRNMLLETQVLATKDHTKWNLPLLLELVQGPLLNPKRLDEAARASKFMRRVVSFFQPFSYRFSNTLKDDDTTSWIELGCSLLQTLIANPDGIRYLAEDKLLRQLADAFAQLEPGTQTPHSEVLFSKARIGRTLAVGYFEMIGALTKSTEGVKLLHQFRLFSAMYKLAELRSRPDVIQCLLDHLDYSQDGHTRVLLGKTLTAGTTPVRVSATIRLAELMAHSPTKAWQVRLMVTQLYDPAAMVCEIAVNALEDACRSLQALEMVVHMRPSLDHLGVVGAGLLTRFLSTSIGVRYLDEIGFIQRELDDWFENRNFEYVVTLELQMARELAIGSLPHTGEGATKSSFDGRAPPHFYGELVKTEEGCDILDHSEHFAVFVDYIREHGLEDVDSEIIGRLKSCLWAVGHIGASSGGLPFLESEYIIQSIVEIAETSPVYSLRGTAYYVLGLVSCTLEGVEILDSLGWQSVCTPLGGPTGLCMPINVANFVDTEPWLAPELPPPESLLLPFPASKHDRSALSALANLSNHILATKASKTLSLLRRRHRDVFLAPGMYYRALEMLANHHYRLAVRRYILELFDAVELGGGGARRVIDAGEDLRRVGEEELARAGQGGKRRGAWTPWRMGKGGPGAGVGVSGAGKADGERSEEDEFDWDEEEEDDEEDSDESETGSEGSGVGEDEGGEVGVVRRPSRRAMEAREVVPALVVRGFLLA